MRPVNFVPCISELLVGCGRIKDSVGGTPTEAVETTALPKKPPMSGVSGSILPTNQRCTVILARAS
jgi:hypothetical protein